MTIEIFPSAEARIEEIWRYTENSWGIEQADKYVRRLGQAMNNLLQQRHLWRPVNDETLKGIFFIRCEYHYIFFRELANHGVGIISLLHESMDMPSRLKEDKDKKS